MTALKIFILSDAVGETGQRVVQATLAQFPMIEHPEIKRYPFIDSADEIRGILSDAKKEQAIVVTTIVNSDLNQLVNDHSQKYQIPYIDYMSNMLQLISQKTGYEPVYQSGAMHELDKEYFERVAAIEFAVKYDDGKSAAGFTKADIVILGVSRTSKTPLSMYLANKAYKVANLPLIPDVALPEQLFQVERHRIFGLTASPDYIFNIRQERLRMMGLDTTSQYSDYERICEELSYAEELYARLVATVINVENRSIEETAQLIEQIWQR